MVRGIASQPSPSRSGAVEQRRRDVIPPIQSTPAFAAPPHALQEEPRSPSPPTPSNAPISTPALPQSTIPLQSTAQAADNAEANASSASASASTHSSSSLGWSSLPRNEIIELVHRSPHIPAFLKDEIERFILRARPTASSPSHAGGRNIRSPRQQRRFTSHSQSQSQSQSNNNDDSETQEDGHLRTKKLWCMDLLLFPASSTPWAVQEGLSEVVQRLTQLSQTQYSSGGPSASGSSSTRSGGALAIILVLDTVAVTYDIHELEDSLAVILRQDRRYSVQFDANGRRWDSTSPTAPLTSFADFAADGGDEVETLKSELTLLQSKLEASSVQIDSLTSRNLSLTSELAESRQQHDFVRSLYDRASASASSAQAAASDAGERIVLLESQLTTGLNLHRNMLDKAIAHWKGKIRQLEAEKEFRERQRELTDGAEIRRKAALWDEHLREEREREEARERRIQQNQEKRAKLAEQLGVTSSTPVAVSDGLGPFAGPPPQVGRVREESPVDEMDELAALAREAAEAGDLIVASNDEGGRSRRSRRAPPFRNEDRGGGGGLRFSSSSNRPAPASAEEMAQHVAAATLSSSTALANAGDDLEDHLQTFSSSLHTSAADADGVVDLGMRMDDFTVPPSTGLNTNNDINSEGEEEGGGGGATWGESLDSNIAGLPEFTSGSLLLNTSSSLALPTEADDSGDRSSASRFEPYTQP